MGRRSSFFVWLVVSLSSGVAVGQGADPSEQRRLELLGGVPREHQRVPATQTWLVSYMRRASLLYLHRLDGLACRELFSLGDEARFSAAVGATSGDHNAVFIEGNGSPRHEDGGPYVFPANTFTKYWPPRADLDTYWHENQHALLEAAGVGVDPRPYGAAMDVSNDSDDHHAFIEGVGQRGAEAYAELIDFEASVRRADQVESEYVAQGRDVTDFGVQRQLWGDAHQRFSRFVKRMKKVANMPASDLSNYRSATGIFFSSVEQVAEWYRKGGLKRSERGEVLPLRPPAWVFFPDLSLMPVQISLADAKGHDLELPGAVEAAPSETKNDVFRQTIVVRVRARGSLSRWTKDMTKNRAIAADVARGTLRIRVVEDDPLASVSVVAGPSNRTVTGVNGPGGASTRFFDVDLSKSEVPLRVTFARRQLSQLRGAQTIHVALEFSDSGKDRLYDSASAQLGFTLGVSSGGPQAASGPATPPPSTPMPSASTTPTSPAKGAPLGAKIGWSLPSGVAAFTGGLETGNNRQLSSSGELELVSGPAMLFKKGDWSKEGGFILELFAKREEKNLVTMDDYLARVRPKDKHPASIAWFERFKHRETKVGGLRAFESFTSGTEKMNHHWFIELDPQRQLWVTVLGDCQVSSKSLDAFTGLVAAMEGTVKGLRFMLASAPPLAVSHSEAAVPRAFTETAIAENEIAQRPPPAPPDPTGGRRKRPSIATAPPQPEPPRVPPTKSSPPGQRSAAVTPSGPPPPPSHQPPPSNGRKVGPPPPAAKAGPPPPAPKTPPAPPGRPPPPPSQMAGAATVRGAFVSIANSSRTPWTRCTVMIPGRRSAQLPSLAAGGRVDLPIASFVVDRFAASLANTVLVRCAEGSVKFPARF